MLTDLELLFSRLAIGVDLDDTTDADSPTWVYDQWTREFVLGVGSLVFGAILLVVGPFSGSWIGQRIGGHGGYEAGLDLGMGVVAFAASGTVLHAVRLLTLRLYWIITARTWEQPSPYRHTPLPSRRVRWVLASTDRDALLQLLCAVATTAVLLWMNP